jgi:hypothetical protein
MSRRIVWSRSWRSRAACTSPLSRPRARCFARIGGTTSPAAEDSDGTIAALIFPSHRYRGFPVACRRCHSSARNTRATCSLRGRPRGRSVWYRTHAPSFSAARSLCRPRRPAPRRQIASCVRCGSVSGTGGRFRRFRRSGTASGPTTILTSGGGGAVSSSRATNSASSRTAYRRRSPFAPCASAAAIVSSARAHDMMRPASTSSGEGPSAAVIGSGSWGLRLEGTVRNLGRSSSPAPTRGGGELGGAGETGRLRR